MNNYKTIDELMGREPLPMLETNPVKFPDNRTLVEGCYVRTGREFPAKEIIPAVQVNVEGTIHTCITQSNGSCPLAESHLITVQLAGKIYLLPTDLALKFAHSILIAVANQLHPVDGDDSISMLLEGGE